MLAHLSAYSATRVLHPDLNITLSETEGSIRGNLEEENERTRSGKLVVTHKHLKEYTDRECNSSLQIQKRILPYKGIFIFFSSYP